MKRTLVNRDEVRRLSLEGDDTKTIATKLGFTQKCIQKVFKKLDLGERRTLWTAKEQRLLKQWIVEGVPLKECAARLGRTLTAVNMCIIRYGLQGHPGATNKCNLAAVNLARELRQTGMTLKEIATQMDRSEMTIYRYLKKTEGQKKKRMRGKHE